MKLKFLGGAGTVTGSKYLLTTDNYKILIDCGLFQGVKNLREKNWQAFPEDITTIDAVILSHAHIDHSGYIPALIKAGYTGKIFCSAATLDLCKVLLPDSGYLQEEDARYANYKKFSKHQPALPLYTEDDARKSLGQFETINFNQTFEPLKGIRVTLNPVGHILGACSIRVEADGKSIIFSGDVGRQNDLVMYPPKPLKDADYLVVESTYGDRRHEEIDAFQFFEDIINTTSKRGGIVLIPSFAVGRTQINLHIIQQLKDQKRIPDLPVHLNSPMAISATEIFCKHHEEHRLSDQECQVIDQNTHYVKTPEESIELNGSKFPSVIISASGMASGGRVLHHLKTLLPHHQHSIVFIGFQAPGTRGDALINGASEIKIHGQYYPVKAQIHHSGSLSAHADYLEIISWLKQSTIQPKRVFVTHGERTASDAMRVHLKETFGWRTCVPDAGEEVELS